ncbi:MAG: DUF1186 family protein [Anaerolineae bacterium]|nr:DUF1186 family protein [Anaerolineae bacterium]
MIEHNYTKPVAKLLSLGDKKLRTNRWMDYLSLGLTSEDIPELIRLAQDTEMAELPWENNEPLPEVFGQIHAWRVLGQLRAVEAIPVLLGILHEVDDDQNDWAGEDIPEALGLIGAPAIAPCLEYLQDLTQQTYARVAVANALAEIVTRHPETRAECIQALMTALENYLGNGETVNAFIISYLMDLKAVEAAPLVEKAYLEELVEIEVCGDYEDFQVQTGLLKKRLTPSPFTSEADLKKLLGSVVTMDEARKRQSQQAKKEKAKAKQAKKARKKSKKR